MLLCFKNPLNPPKPQFRKVYQANKTAAPCEPVEELEDAVQMKLSNPLRPGKFYRVLAFFWRPVQGFRA